MTTFTAADPYPLSNRAWARLLLACILSFVLHLALLMGVPVNPTGGTPLVTPVISARLEQATLDTPAETVKDLQPSSDAGPHRSATTDPLADPVTKKEEPKPEPIHSAVAPPQAAPSAGLDLPLIRDPVFYPAKQLDVYPQPLAEIKLNYPERAAADRIDGRLLMLLLIDEFGIVTEVSVVEADPPEYFEEATSEVFRVMRFAPGVRQGRAVKSRVLVQVRYAYGESAGSVR